MTHFYISIHENLSFIPLLVTSIRMLSSFLLKKACDFITARILLIILWLISTWNKTYIIAIQRDAIHVEGVSSCPLVVLLDRQGHEAVVLGNVPLENVRAWSQNTLKACPVEFNALERTSSHDCRCSGTIQQQGYLAWKMKKYVELNRQLHWHGIVTDSSSWPQIYRSIYFSFFFLH